MIKDNDRDGIRELIQWTYSAYEPHRLALLNESHDIDQWLTNVAELIPRLLLKNILPLHDSVAVRNPEIVITTYVSTGSPPALHDPGLIPRRSAFVRNVFSEDEFMRLSKQDNEYLSFSLMHIPFC